MTKAAPHAHAGGSSLSPPRRRRIVSEAVKLLAPHEPTPPGEQAQLVGLPTELLVRLTSRPMDALFVLFHARLFAASLAGTLGRASCEEPRCTSNFPGVLAAATHCARRLRQPCVYQMLDAMLT